MRSKKRRCISLPIFLFFPLFFGTLSNSYCQNKNTFLNADTVNTITYKLKGKTASGRFTTKIKKPFLAISPDLLYKYPLGSQVELYKCRWAGKYFVYDVMAKKNKKTVDIFYKGKRKNPVTCLCKLAG